MSVNLMEFKHKLFNCKIICNIVLLVKFQMLFNGKRVIGSLFYMYCV